MAAQDGMTYPQNYDVIIKWLADAMKGQTLEVLGIPSGQIEEVCGFEPAEIAVTAERVDVMVRDDTGGWFHLEEQRNLCKNDLYRFASYHFLAARQWGPQLTDVILASGDVMAGEKVIETTNGTYRPVVVDFTQRDGPTRLAEIRAEVEAGTFEQWFELVVLPLYGTQSGPARSVFVEQVLRFETALCHDRKISVRLVAATFVMANKLIEHEQLEALWEDIKMLDIIEFARQKGLEEGIEQGEEKGERKGLLQGIELGLHLRFGYDSLDVLPLVYQIHDLPRLHAVQDAIKHARDLAEFTDILTTRILVKKSSPQPAETAPERLPQDPGVTEEMTRC